MLKEKRDKSQLVDASYKLTMLQSYPLNTKEKLSMARLKEFYDEYEGKVYIAVSGGKDSQVLLHLCRRMEKEYNLDPAPAVFSNTGIEDPYIIKHIKKMKKEDSNLITIKPKRTFGWVLENHGFGMFSKENSQKIYDIRNTKSERFRKARLGEKVEGLNTSPIPKMFKDFATERTDLKVSDKCCKYLKKDPFRIYEKETGRKAILGTMAYESNLRVQKWLKEGCNAFNNKRPTSTPLAFWLEKDIWDYIKYKELKVCELYKMGEVRTGCIVCAFGQHLVDEEVDKFERFKLRHPGLYKYFAKGNSKRKGLQEYFDITREYRDKVFKKKRREENGKR